MYLKFKCVLGATGRCDQGVSAKYLGRGSQVATLLQQKHNKVIFLLSFYIQLDVDGNSLSGTHGYEPTRDMLTNACHHNPHIDRIIDLHQNKTATTQHLIVTLESELLK